MINLVVLLYFAFIVKWHYATSLLVLKYLLLLTCIREMIHLQDFTFTGFLQFQKLLVASSSFIDFKVMVTCVTNHYKCTIHLTFSEGSLFCKFL